MTTTDESWGAKLSVDELFELQMSGFGDPVDPIAVLPVEYIAGALERGEIEPTDRPGEYKILISPLKGVTGIVNKVCCVHPYQTWHDEWLLTFPPKLKQRRCGVCGATTQDRNAWKDKRYAI